MLLLLITVGNLTRPFSLELSAALGIRHTFPVTVLGPKNKTFDPSVRKFSLRILIVHILLTDDSCDKKTLKFSLAIEQFQKTSVRVQGENMDCQKGNMRDYLTSKLVKMYKFDNSSIYLLL